MDYLREITRDFGDVIKHEARLKLWFPVLKRLHSKLKRPLKYFTLAGPKAYDVVLWELKGLLRFDGRGYPDVCFCESRPNNFANAKRLLGNTRGILGKFEDVILKPCEERNKPFWDLFPYDAYNLDFCGTWFERDQPPVSETFKAIEGLIRRHIRLRKFSPFLLFLTIKIDKDMMNPEVIEAFKENINANLRRMDFHECLIKIVGSDIEDFIQSRFEDFVMISVPKVVGFRLISGRGKITDLNRCIYSRNGYSIGKFVLIIEKEREALTINPSWYIDFVRKSADIQSILRIERLQIPSETLEDLKRLKEVIKGKEEG